MTTLLERERELADLDAMVGEARALERRVAEMAASGMTNRQIAQMLFLTVKTIETHLSPAYDKLGIRSRRRLAESLAGGG